jgi:low temperature requirement protein LtrA
MADALALYIIIAFGLALVETVVQATQRNEGQNLAAFFLFVFLLGIPLTVFALLCEAGDIIMVARRHDDA